MTYDLTNTLAVITNASLWVIADPLRITVMICLLGIVALLFFNGRDVLPRRPRR